ncbi:TPA: DAK2 domain-containing protein [bacterium]|nr:DAK2 domain-containing protein [bacterium]
MNTINGVIFKQMLVSGANNLFNHYPEVDALNVFPVPDGDTGTNMNLTMTSGSKEVLNLNTTNIYDVARAFSRGLLMGARGNSGVILSQIFRGFAQALEGKEKINIIEFCEAWWQAKDVAYKAVMRPVEGTILTVIRESSEVLKNNATNFRSIEDAMEFFIKEAKSSLNRTPELLPILKEVGVVDSGGAGLVKVLEGFNEGLRGRVVERKQISEILESPIAIAGKELENEEFGYCTEFILDLNYDNKKEFTEKRMNCFLQSHGNSIVLVRDENLVKVHVHTLKPGVIFNYAQQYGEFVSLKVENMQLQHSHIIEGETQHDVELNNQAKKEYALISVSIGEGLNEMFSDLRVDQIVSGGQTMNPSTEDFVSAIKACNAKNIFILPNNSNIIMAATQACEVVEGVNCKVIPTKTIPQGLVACMVFNPEVDVDTNFEEMSNIIASVKTGQITFAIKDTKIDGIDIKAGNFIGINGKHILSCSENRLEATKEMIKQLIDEDSSLVTIIYGEETSSDEAKELEEFVQNSYKRLDVEIHNGGQPVYSYIISVE